MIQLTIFTPTYNRAYILSKLYKSLCDQTNKNFIWLIVDDGSNDNTRDLINDWIKEDKLTIIYIYQENSGKSAAHNTGVVNCTTELFICVDSDDYLKMNAVNILMQTWNSIKVKEEISGIIGYRGKNENEVLGTEFPRMWKEARLNELYRNNFTGDTALLLRTDILKANFFPIIDGEKFITENYLYDLIDEKYKYVLLREILIICEYQIDGYTNNSLKLYEQNPVGWSIYYLNRTQMFKSYVDKIYYLSQSICYQILSGTKQLNYGKQKITIKIISRIFGGLLAVKRRIQYNKRGKNK